jgi:hypothetical protein
MTKIWSTRPSLGPLYAPGKRLSFRTFVGFLLKNPNDKYEGQAVLGGVSMCPKEGIEPLSRSFVAVDRS